MQQPDLLKIVQRQPHPLLFATISGAHLYGFPSIDSDFDLRGTHVLPLREVLSLDESRETIEFSDLEDGFEIDLVTHDIAKFFKLLLRPNGYVLEQLCSPLRVHRTPEHDELLSLVPQIITRNHAHHYLGFGRTNHALFLKGNPPRVKPLLYTFRGLLTGIHLMRSEEVEANLEHLQLHFKLPWLPDLIARKREGAEKGSLGPADVDFFTSEYERLTRELVEARDASGLPEKNSAGPALNDLIYRSRLKYSPENIPPLP
jgi:predicted nucleotidyltransferase